ncbi:unnamed protein product, partial [Linum tenue]
TFWRIVKNRSTEDFEGLPYICTLLNASLWTYYGVIKPGAYLVATVNGFGIVVEIVYVALFITYAPRKMKVYIRCRFDFLWLRSVSPSVIVGYRRRGLTGIC